MSENKMFSHDFLRNNYLRLGFACFLCYMGCYTGKTILSAISPFLQTNGVFTALRGTEKANIVAGDGEAGKYWVIENGNQAGFIKLELEKYIDLATYEPDSLIVNVIVKLLRGMENMFVWRP